MLWYAILDLLSCLCPAKILLTADSWVSSSQCLISRNLGSLKKSLLFSAVNIILYSNKLLDQAVSVFLIETVFLEILLFRLLLFPLRNTTHIGIVIELLQLGSGDWVHFYWLVEAALLCHGVELLVEASHVVCMLAGLLPFWKSFNDIIVVRISTATWARPCTCEPSALVAIRFFTLFRDTVMFLKRVLAKTLEVIGTVRRDIVKALTLAFSHTARSFFPSWIQIVMVFELMVAETFRLWSNHLAVLSLTISPG